MLCYVQAPELLPRVLAAQPPLRKLGHLLGSVAARAVGSPTGVHAAFAPYGIDAVSVSVQRTQVTCLVRLTLSAATSQAASLIHPELLVALTHKPFP